MTKTPEIIEIPSDIAALGFEEALRELEEIVKKIEDGSVTLEKSIELYVRGNYLRRHCDKKLQDASLKIEKIIELNDGRVETEPF